MTHRCVISVDAAGIEPVHPRSTTSSWKFEGQACASRDSFPGYRLGNHARGGRTPFADAESAVSGSHKPRPPLKSQRRSCFLRASAASEPRLLTLTASASLSCSQRESFSPALPFLIAASRSALVHVDIRDLHPLPAAVAAIEKS